jgi:hypothetical protein
LIVEPSKLQGPCPFCHTFAADSDLQCRHLQDLPEKVGYLILICDCGFHFFSDGLAIFLKVTHYGGNTSDIASNYLADILLGHARNAELSYENILQQIDLNFVWSWFRFLPLRRH